jgi:DHA2 family multidrug resistance protein
MVTSMNAQAAPIRTAAGFAMMCLGMFMAILDVQVVATSIPTIEHALAVPADRISWIQTAYLIAEVIAIPLTGILTRILSMRWLFVGALAIFTLSSAGCAASTGFPQLIAWRVIQGLSGGTLIPSVFSAIFLFFPGRRQPAATTVAGVLAVLAPTIGPVVGGWITATYSWHWLFLINIAPGVLAAGAAAFLLPRERPDWRAVRTLDALALALMAAALAALEIGLKEAPRRGWLSPLIVALWAVVILGGAAFVAKTLRNRRPLVLLSEFRVRRFAVGCAMSFILGVGLFGSTYLLPVFLGAARGYSALDIGKVMLVTGVAQLATSPVAVALESRVGARTMAAFGFAVFALGLGLSAFETTATGFREMFWPQILRGSAIMFCLVPPTRMALGHLPDADVADASGLFNLMRNLGGAIGLALIDTVLYGRAPRHADAIVAKLQAGDTETARAVGIPLDLFAMRGAGPIDPSVKAMLAPMIEKLAFVRAANEAWAMLAALTGVALLTLALAPRPAPSVQAQQPLPSA